MEVFYLVQSFLVSFWKCMKYVDFVNQFFPSAPFLYPVETPEKGKVFGCFQGVEKGCIGKKWVNISDSI